MVAIPCHNCIWCIWKVISLKYVCKSRHNITLNGDCMSKNYIKNAATNQACLNMLCVHISVFKCSYISVSVLIPSNLASENLYHIINKIKHKLWAWINVVKSKNYLMKCVILPQLSNLKSKNTQIITYKECEQQFCLN